jgi:hypothetical protein
LPAGRSSQSEDWTLNPIEGFETASLKNYKFQNVTQLAGFMWERHLAAKIAT